MTVDGMWTPKSAYLQNTVFCCCFGVVIDPNLVVGASQNALQGRPTTSASIFRHPRDGSPARPKSINKNYFFMCHLKSMSIFEEWIFNFFLSERNISSTYFLTYHYPIRVYSFQNLYWMVHNPSELTFY